MQIAVIADIHGNLAALRAVAAQLDAHSPDIVVVAGDTVNRGPRPRECWEFVQERAARDRWQLLLGNHEEYVLDVLRDPSDRAGIEGAIRRSVRWTAAQLRDPAALALLPKVYSATDTDGAEVRVTHATMRGTRDNLLVTNSDELIREQIAPAPLVFCGGHTHRPFIRQVDATLVMNVGSVGMPFDGDTRACYGVVSGGSGGYTAEIVRVRYDRDQAERDFVQSGFLEDAGAVGVLIRDEFRTAEPRLFTWFSEYQPRVLSGELSVESSAELYLASLGRSGGAQK